MLFEMLIMFRKVFVNVDHNQHDDVLHDSKLHIDARNKRTKQNNENIYFVDQGLLEFVVEV